MRSKLSYANVMSTIAVFVALGGSSYAAVKITGKNVVNGSLTGLDIKNNSVGAPDIRANAINSDDVADGSLESTDFKSGALPAGARGATGARGPRGLTGPPGPATGAAGGDLSGNYPNPTIAANAVDGATIADGSVTGGDIDESTLGSVPSVGSQTIVNATQFSNIGFGVATNVTATCPEDRLAVRGTIADSLNVTLNSVTYGRSTYTVNVTGTGPNPAPHFVDLRVTCFGGTA